MSKPLPKLDTSSLDSLFSTEEQRQEEKLEKIMMLSVDNLHVFRNHPFKVRMDEDMIQLIDTVKENGVLVPAIVRPSPYGEGYEIVAGHRRQFASIQNGLTELPCIVRDLTDEQATIIMVDSNIQREHILPTERGFAYKMKLDAMKRQGRRTDLTSSQVGTKLKRADSILAEQVGESRNQIQRYIRLTYLIEPLREYVDGVSEDGKKLGLSQGVELSYLSEELQNMVVKYIYDLEIMPSHAQAIRMKNLSKENRLDENVIYSIMTEEKANQKEKLSFKMEEINQFFPRDYTPRQKSEVILKLLKGWSKKRDKQQER
ncbi:chromosome-partitioning protein Spo0J [Thomasclavelia cocleata]|uniref:Chromosome-partitioning protein Spo0J n=1 Tax=Thomasclavelia cocleata TaxID=69824 RepID=A0A829Z9W9_9FIRM|nr:ParB/RepB/Spo0J family partition protein [Thomasclavelia cocleata]MDE6952755.1 ParB/RepB/Spo0J family partition protein [Erysipelotrichales bacterium]GFI40745.1 chromosome-partitioning protein Spo0J [Thomasclavelia cocleata]